MTSSLAAQTPDSRASGLSPEFTSRVRLARPKANRLDEREEELESAAPSTEEPHLSEPPLDLASFIARRWSMSDDAALELLSGWLRDYQPQGNHSAAVARELAAGC
jgi:hypothetical protein